MRILNTILDSSKLTHDRAALKVSAIDTADVEQPSICTLRALRPRASSFVRVSNCTERRVVGSDR